MTRDPSRLGSGAALVAGLALMASMAIVHGVKLATETIGAARRLIRETSEQRRLETYGVCGARGYGYLRRVVGPLPDPHAVPLVRYHGFNRFGALALPFERDRVDERILVGINLRDRDMEEQSIACRRIDDRGASSSWIVQPDTDIDALVGLRFALRATRATGPTSVRLVLYDSPLRRRQLGSWEVPIAAYDTGAVTVRSGPMSEPFSFHNLSIGFVVDVTGPSLAALDLLVIPVDARRYVRVHTDAGCATWVRADLLPDVRAPRGPWRDWIDSLQGSR